MEAVKKSGSNGRNRRRSRANTADQENSDGQQLNKDAALRERRNNCWIEVEDMICDILDDNSIRTVGTWEGRKEKIEEARKRLLDPQVLLHKLINSIEPSVTENTGVKLALREVESLLKLSRNPVPNQDCINFMDKEVRVKKEELQFLREQVMQNNATGIQLVMEARTSFIVSRMLSKVGSSCLGTISSTKHGNPVQGHLVQKEGEKLILNFHPLPGSTQINQNGNNDVIHNLEMTDQEEPVEEVNLTLAFVGERLAKLTLEMPKSDQFNDASREPVNVENLEILADDVPDPSEGSSNAKANEANTMLTFFDNSAVSSMCQTYNVYNGFVNAVAEIFEKHRHIDKEFRVKHAHFQSFCMNTLGEIYHNLSHPMICEPDTTLYEVMVKDLEGTGLELSWLRPMLEKAREMLEVKRLQEIIDSSQAKLDELKKKQRLE